MRGEFYKLRVQIIAAQSHRITDSSVSDTIFLCTLSDSSYPFFGILITHHRCMQAALHQADNWVPILHKPDFLTCGISIH